MAKADSIKIISDKIFAFIEASTAKKVTDVSIAIRAHADDFATTIYEAIADNAVANIRFRMSGNIFQYSIDDGETWSNIFDFSNISVVSVNGKQGVVTLTTADIADSTNKRYVTDADLTKLANTSGVNTGDFITAITDTSTIDLIVSNGVLTANIINKWFSSKYHIETGESVTVPAKYQQIISEELINDGEIEVLGELVLIN